MRRPLPLSERPLDLALAAFFAINLLLVSYVISLEQLVIADPASFRPPAWPPRAALQLIHWWERTYDPLLWARPAWYRATIWLDCVAFGPFYLAAVYAYLAGRDWIRLPSIVWASMMFTSVFVILFDELHGEHAAPNPLVVVGANAAWLLVPIVVLFRVGRSEHPFTTGSI
jgi:hypothetical protein